MLALRDFLLHELLALLSDAPSVDPYASEESESQSQSQSQSQVGHTNALLKQQPRVMLVCESDTAAQILVVVDCHFSIDAFIPQQVVTQLMKSDPNYKSLASMRGSVVRIDKYHFSTPARCCAMDNAVRAKGSVSAASSRKTQGRVCLWVDEVSVIDKSNLVVDDIPDVCENAQIATLLRELNEDQLSMRLVTRQGLSSLPKPSQADGDDAKQFDDEHPLLDEDCIIPEDQEAQLDAQDGWGAFHDAKQTSDSQLIAENGSEPWTEFQGSLDVERASLSQTKTATAPPPVVRVDATELSQSNDSESVQDCHGFHFQKENIQKTFVQCSDSESDSESSGGDRSVGDQRAVSQADTKIEVQVLADTNSSQAHRRSSRLSFLLNEKPSAAERPSHEVDLTDEPSERAPVPTTRADAVGRERAVSELGHIYITDLTGDDTSIPQPEIHDSPLDGSADPNESQTQMSEANKEEEDSRKQAAQVVALANSGGEVIALDGSEREFDAEPWTQLPDSYDANQKSSIDQSGNLEANSSDVEHHSQDTRNGPYTQAPDAASASQGNEADSYPAMDVDVWCTQPNDDSRMLDSQYGSFGETQDREEDGSSEKTGSAEETRRHERIVEASEDSGVAPNEAPDEGHTENPASEPQTAQASPPSPSNSAAIQAPSSDLLTQGTNALPAETLSVSRTSKASPTGQKRGQKRPLGLSGANSQIAQKVPPKITPTSNSDKVVDVRHRKLARQTESPSPPKRSVPDNPESPLAKNRPAIPHSIQQRSHQQSHASGVASSASGGKSSSHNARRLTPAHARNATTSVSSQLRASKRYEHLFPPLHMESLKKLIAEQTRSRKTRTTTRTTST